LPSGRGGTEDIRPEIIVGFVIIRKKARLTSGSLLSRVPARLRHDPSTEPHPGHGGGNSR